MTAAHDRTFRERRRERTAANGGIAPVAVHNEYTYDRWGCPCEDCRAAHRVASQDKRRKSRDAARRQADELLAGRLDEYVTERRQAGRTWWLISRDIYDDIRVRITDRMLKSWYEQAAP